MKVNSFQRQQQSARAQSLKITHHFRSRRKGTEKAFHLIFVKVGDKLVKMFLCSAPTAQHINKKEYFEFWDHARNA